MLQEKKLQPLLTILIPSYSYPEGVERILSHLFFEYLELFEIFISDDSPDDCVFAVFEKFENKFNKIHYHRNFPALGASKNWNLLLSKASGKYCVMIHHDEFPSDISFIKNLFYNINLSNHPDLIFFGCKLIFPTSPKYFIHVPRVIQKILISNFPSYILIRNFIGPVSSIAFKRKPELFFDINLTWYVDVDFYYRLIKNSTTFFYSDIFIVSEFGRTSSITHLIKNNLNLIKRNELLYLIKKYPDLIYFKKIFNLKFKYLILDIFWFSFRFVQKIIRIFYRSRL
jgi:glycosyltransferase involved in cell wall biosynthesis